MQLAPDFLCLSDDPKMESAKKSKIFETICLKWPNYGGDLEIKHFFPKISLCHHYSANNWQNKHDLQLK
jgi:hypothetical protein